jgi:hypothetical protein
MDTFISFAVEALRLVPLILAFYVPALIGVVLLKERGEGYRIKAALVVTGFGGIVAAQLLLRSVSMLQMAQIVTISLVQIAAALLFAALTAYKLAD